MGLGNLRMLKQRFITIYLGALRLVVRLILALVGTIEIRGKQNFPESGPYIVVTNHLSKADVALVLLAIPKQRIRVFAADKWRDNPLFGPLLALSGAIFVKRGEVDRKALRAAVDALKKGESLGMAPEGTRSRTQTLQKGRSGPAYIASRAQVKLLPIGIINSDQFQANILRFRRTDFQLNIGEPFKLPDLDRRPKSKELDAYTELIMAHLAALLPDRYHGYYANSPALKALRSEEDPWPAACQIAGLDSQELGATSSEGTPSPQHGNDSAGTDGFW